MSVNSLPNGSVVGIDANVFIYHFCGRSKECTRLLERIERGEIRGVVTNEALHEVLHRLMVLEAMQAGHISGKNPARKLKQDPDIVRSLTRYYRDTRAISAIGVKLLPGPKAPIRASQSMRDRYGLLTNDSLLAATLLHHGISILVTADRDFERVEELSVTLVTDVT